MVLDKYQQNAYIALLTLKLVCVIFLEVRSQ